MIFFNEETTYEYMAITKNEIINTITVILDRLDNLENKKKQLLEMKQQGWVSTDAYKNLQNYNQSGHDYYLAVGEDKRQM